MQGLHRDPLAVAKARSTVRAKGNYGRVSIRHWEGESLPYADNLVNLIVMRDARHEIRDEELKRVLAPRGVIIAPEGTRIPHPVSRIRDRLVMFTKPWPEEMDQWTHYLYDATGNAVSEDTAVDTPFFVQWYSGPKWARSHDRLTSMPAMVYYVYFFLSCHSRHISVFNRIWL